MTPEQRQAKREEQRAKWNKLTPEERAARTAEMRKKWDALSDEEKAKIRQKSMDRHQNDSP